MTDSYLDLYGENSSRLLDDDVVFLIVVVLMEFDSLNLTQLIKLLNKPKMTLHRKVKEMLDNRMIELDETRTSSKRGIYYRVTISTARLFQTTHQKLSNLKPAFEKNPELFALRFSNGLRSLSALNNALSYQFTEYLRKNPAEINNFLNNKDSVGAFSMSDIRINRPEERKEFYRVLNEFYEGIKKFEAPDGAPPDSKSHMLYLSAFPMGKIIPQELIIPSKTNEKEDHS